MIKVSNRERTIEELNENMVESVFNIIPNISDKVLDYNEKNFHICDLINNNFIDKRKYSSEITPALLVLSGVQSRMKQQFSISELPLALTSKEVIESTKMNLSYNSEDTFLKESNIRAILSKYEQNDKEKIEFNNDFIKFFNNINKSYLNAANINCNIHIVDCSVLDVNIDNENYEGSSITHKGGKKLRGYKIGMIRGVTNNGGVVEEVCMSTAKDHDVNMIDEMLRNSNYFKSDDFVMLDRGFLDIELFKSLTKKGLKVIIPARKNMEISIEAKRLAIENNKWVKHPNPKRQGQDITLVSGLERCWLSEKDRLKKPEKLELEYKINTCVIRFDKKKNKDIIEDEILLEDEEYAYAVIMTNDVSLSCGEIIRMYEMRPEIEEDFRQLKDFWGLNMYRSTRYHIISFITILSLLGYNLYKVYTESEEGSNYIGKSLIVEERHGLYIVKNVRTAIVTKHYFYIFKEDELLDLYADLDKNKRMLIKQYLTL